MKRFVLRAASLWFPLLFVSLTLLLLQSCGSSKYLGEDEALLTKNSIEIIDPENVDDVDKLKYQLSSFFEQKPNTNFFLLFPRETYYYRNSAPSDTSWYNRWVRKNLAEEPAILDSTASLSSAQGMQLFLRNLKGFYNAKVEVEEKVKNKSGKVTYKVTAGKRYFVNSVEYIGYDQEVLDIMYSIKEESLLNSGAPIDVSLFDQERNRISSHLRDIGYANFKANRLKVYGDSSTHERRIDIILEIVPKPDSSNYVKYTVGSINVYNDYFQNDDLSKFENYPYKDINFYKQSNSFVVKPERLESMISMKPGEAFNETNRVKTFQKLNSLDVFKFSIIDPVIDSLDDTRLNLNILLTPQNSKWITDLGFETFYSTVTNGRQLIGASAFASLENRNLFGGAERNRLNFEIGGEFQFTDPVGLATSTLRIQDNLEYPRFVDVFGSVSLLNKIGLLNDNNYNDFKLGARTNLAFGFSAQKILGLYDIISFNSSVGYFYGVGRNQFSLRQLAFNLNSYDLTNEFIQRINNNPFIVNSLQNNLFTGILFRDFNYIYTSPKSIRGNRFKFLGNFEVSGMELNIINSLSNKLSGNTDPWRLFGIYDFSKYYRVELDGRYYHDFNEASSFAARLNFAIARPFSDSEQVPFIKQFYVGGPSGIRAWQIRELGPGSYDKPNLITETSTLFFQQGDLKMQFSLEYRFDILYWIESAFFLDGGNVWTLDNSDTRIGSQLTKTWIDEIALGYGWGIRLDLDYFLIRLDFGYKLRRPFTNALQSQWIPLRGQKIGNINIAINYPF